MIVRDQPSIFKVLFSWRGTILPKVLPPLGVVMLLSAVIGGLSYVDIFHFPEFPLVITPAFPAQRGVDGGRFDAQFLQLSGEQRLAQRGEPALFK